MKRTLPARIAAAAAALSLLTGIALADTDLSAYSITDATVAAVAHEDIVAPCSGTISSFDWAAGDAIHAGQELMSMLTTDITAPEAGTVAAVFAQTGDNAADVLSRYGAILSIEPAQQLQLKATTTGAYNEEANRTIHVGETLYFREGTAGETGSGTVIAVSGTSYVVDILKGEFDTNKSLTLYRSDGYTEKSKVGKGTVTRRDPVAVKGTGRMTELLVKPGDPVEAGQVVARVLSPDAPAGTVPTITAGSDGVIAAVAVAPGQQVWRGTLLLRIWRTDALEIVAEVDEVDLKGLRVGDTVPATLDTDPATVLKATVTEIGGAAFQRQNAACVTVHAAISSAEARIGGGARLYLPK